MLHGLLFFSPLLARSGRACHRGIFMALHRYHGSRGVGEDKILLSTDSSWHKRRRRCVIGVYRRRAGGRFTRHVYRHGNGGSVM